jgi:hypothetical protein
MTFTGIVLEIADRLNLTSEKALARIGRSVNERYRWLASSLYLQTTVRRPITATTTIGNRSLIFNCEKLYAVFNPAYTPVWVLGETDFDTLRNRPVGTDPPQEYAIQLMGASTVTIYLSSTPATAYVLGADAAVNLATLSGMEIPAFAESFHDILVYGGMATELDKMEKPELAEVQNSRFEQRLSELRLYIALSAYRTVIQGSRSSMR